MIVRKHSTVFHLKTNLQENYPNLNLQNFLGKYISYNFKLPFSRLKIQLKSINFFQNILTQIQILFITYTTYKPNIYNTYSKHHKAINCHMLKLQRCNRMLMIHWPNLRLYYNARGLCPIFKMLKTWEKMPRGELETQ